MDIERKMFCINPDGVQEWVIARSREEALDLYKSMVGQGTIDEAYQGYLNDEKKEASETAFKEFLEYYFQEEDSNKDFAYTDVDVFPSITTTKPISEWLAEAKEVPCYFACQDY